MLVFKIVVGGIFILTALGFLIASWIAFQAMRDVRKRGSRAKGKVTARRLVANKKCNGLPGWH